MGVFEATASCLQAVICFANSLEMTEPTGAPTASEKVVPSQSAAAWLRVRITSLSLITKMESNSALRSAYAAGSDSLTGVAGSSDCI